VSLCKLLNYTHRQTLKIMNRRERQLERLGGYPDTSPSNPKEYALLRAEDYDFLDQDVDWTAEFYYSDGHISDQELTVETPGVALTDKIRRAASVEMDQYEF